MIKLGKSITTLAVFAALTAPVMAQTGGPLEDGINACGVPVCSIESTLEALKPLNENQRYNYVNELIQTYANSQDEAVLKNLVEISKQLKELSIQLGDADWVVRTISTLGNNAILNLAKYSKIEGEKMGELYKQLDTAAKRYEVIAYYQGQVDKIEEIKTLAQLVKFAKIAQAHSVSIGDESWIPVSAEQLAAKATVKIVALDPGHEGIYKIKTTKTDENILDVDKIVVLDSSSDKNLVVNFINTKHSQVVFTYSGATIVGNKIQGTQVDSGSMSSKFELTFDRATGQVSGEIQTTRTQSITFEGQRSFSVGEIVQGTAPEVLTENDVLGVMEGSIMGVKGTLSVQSFEPNVYSASFIADRGELKIDYVGKFYPKKGVLSLTHKNKSKLVLSLRKDGETTKWSGVSFSVTNGSVSDASFQPLQ